MHRTLRGAVCRAASSAVMAALLFCLCGLLNAHGAAAQATADAAAQTSTNNEAAWQQDLAAWRAQRAREIDAPDGWLTLVGLEWLKPGNNAIGAAADNQIRLKEQAPEHLAIFAVTANGVQLQAPPRGFPADLRVDGEPAVAGPLSVSGAKPSLIEWHSITLQVLNRGGRYTLRVKDSDAPARTAFHGLNWYAPDPHLRVEARWIPYATRHIEKIPTAIGTTLDLPSPGVAEFTLDGKLIRLEPVIEDPQGKTLFFILRDETRYDATYETARYLHTGLPDHGLDQPGSLIMDFNRLENPPCAYSTYATCPLPPMDNRLIIALKAGEKRYEH